MDIKNNRRILYVVVLCMSFVLICVLIGVLSYFNSIKNEVVIENIDECTNGITNYSKENLFGGLYNVVAEQNKINNVENKKTYEANIRVDTCKTAEHDIDGVISYTTEGIIDINELKYSYEISFVWLKDEIGAGMDLGVVNAYCLSEKQMIYDDFRCGDNSVVLKKVDPIVNLLPFFGDGFKMVLRSNENGYYVNVEMEPSEQVYDDGKVDEFTNNVKKVVEKFFENNGLDMEKYEVKYTYKIW